MPVQLTFEDRRHFTRAGKPKKRPGPKPSAFPNVRHRPRARAQVLESAARHDAREAWAPELPRTDALRGVRARRAQDASRRLPRRGVLRAGRSPPSHRRGRRQRCPRARHEELLRACQSPLQRSARPRPRPGLGRSLPPSRSHERAPGTQRDRLLPLELQEAPGRDERSCRASTRARRRVGSRAGRRSARKTTAHVPARKRAPCSYARAWQKHGLIHPGETTTSAELRAHAPRWRDAIPSSHPTRMREPKARLLPLSASRAAARDWLGP